MDYKDEIRKASKKIPDSIVSSIFCNLLERREKSKKRVDIFFPESSPTKFPFVYIFGILTLDWPGMLEGATSAITETGWNMEYIKGITLLHNSSKIALNAIGIFIENKEAISRFQKDKASLRNKLNKLTSGKWEERELFIGQTKKVELYEEVMAILKKIHKGKIEVPLVREALKFFMAESDEYLQNREMETIARLISTNYKFKNRIRKSGGRPQIKVKTLKTTKGEFTGISMVCYDRNFSLSLVLSAIGEVVSQYNIKYNREFTTYDGITVYRVEIEGIHNPELIEKSLRNRIFSRRFEKFTFMESMGGFEHYARAIIPFLVKEYNTSEIPQVYISPGFTTEHNILFKIIIVTGTEKKSISELATKLDKTSGLSLLDYKTPTLYGKTIVNTMDIKADIKTFKGPEEIYSIIAENIESIIGKFRDFDKGMRIQDIKKFELVKEKLKNYASELVKEFFYGLEDFYRASAPLDEIAQIINIGIRSLKQAPKIITKQRDNKATFLAIASNKGIFPEIFPLFSPYEPMISKVQIGERIVILTKLHKSGNSLSNQELKSITSSIEPYL